MNNPLDRPTPFQTSVAALCRSTADWRSRKADEYDRDARNLRTAAALNEFAEYILLLPGDDPRLFELQRLTGDGDEFLPGQQLLYELGRFRFHHSETGFDAFLTALLQHAADDRGEQGHFGGRLPAGDDPWG